MVRQARPAVPPGIELAGVIAIGRRLQPGHAAAIADALMAGGVRAFEITLNEPESDALVALAAVARHADGGHLAVGAGTVTSFGAATRAVDAGATFLVMPHTDVELVAWANGRGIPSFPGAFTPTEILAAWRAGATAVKLFPASVAGPSFVREVRGPFPEIDLVPTGGVTLESLPGFIAAGALAVGLGGWLIGDGEPAGIADRSARAVRAVREARGAS